MKFLANLANSTFVSHDVAITSKLPLKADLSKKGRSWSSGLLGFMAFYRRPVVMATSGYQRVRHQKRVGQKRSRRDHQWPGTSGSVRRRLLHYLRTILCSDE
eukprot:2871941-Pleurochrysis_carterae.AAC.1